MKSAQFALLGVLLLIPIAWFILFGFAPGEEKGNSYGFTGTLFTIGAQDHEIYHDPNIESETILKLAAYLSRIGYFGEQYGGVVQFKREDEGYRVFLTYSESYWEMDAFKEEVSGIRDDLSSLALNSPTAITLVDAVGGKVQTQDFENIED